MAEWIDAGATTDDTWDRQKELVGKYLRKQVDIGPNDSNMYHLETDDGKVIGVWGSTVIDTKFNNIPLNSMVKIKSLGKAKSEKTGREYEDYKILYQPAEVESDTTGEV